MKLLIEGELSQPLRNLLERAAKAVALTEDTSIPCCAALLLMDDEQMREANRSARGIDESTDVLSFPAVSFPKGRTARELPELLRREWDVQEGCCYIGDILISLPRAHEQAAAYGHSFGRELSYLLVHGLFHLLGYDHLEDEDKRRMRQVEESALLAAKASDEELLRIARDASKQAYAPYSDFMVGAALRAEDGRIFTGCNVENAAFTPTSCAERTALFKAVSEGVTRFTDIAVVGSRRGEVNKQITSPCGVCRQALFEFGGPELNVIMAKTPDDFIERSMDELLPFGFGPSNVAGNKAVEE